MGAGVGRGTRWPLRNQTASSCGWFGEERVGDVLQSGASTCWALAGTGPGTQKGQALPGAKKGMGAT